MSSSPTFRSSQWASVPELLVINGPAVQSHIIDYASTARSSRQVYIYGLAARSISKEAHCCFPVVDQLKRFIPNINHADFSAIVYTEDW